MNDKNDKKKKKDPSSKGKEVKIVVPAGLPAEMTLERDAGAGFETADRDSYAIPFLIILQSNSPQCDPDNDAYIEGVRPGMFFNTATEESYDGKIGVTIVPVHFNRRLVEWVPRDEGGGYKGDYAPEEIDLAKLKRDDSGRFILENGNYLADTRYHFCIQLTDGEPRFVVVSMTSTQIRKSRNWMTKMSMLKMISLKTKTKFTPPMFSHKYLLTTVSEANEKGSWKGFDVKMVGALGADEVNIYIAAKEFKKQIESGRAKIEESRKKEDVDEF